MRFFAPASRGLSALAPNLTESVIAFFCSAGGGEPALVVGDSLSVLRDWVSAWISRWMRFGPAGNPFQQGSDG